MNELGKFLEELRGKMSLRKAAEESGLSHAYIRDLELGINRKTKTPLKPSAETLRKISKAYNYDYLELAQKAGILTENEKEMARRFSESTDVIGIAELMIDLLHRRYQKEHLNSIRPSLESLKEKYSELVGNKFDFSIDQIRNLASVIKKSGAPQDYSEFLRFFDEVTKIVHENDPRPYPLEDLYYQIQHPLITFKNAPLSDDDRIRISAYLEGLFAGRIDSEKWNERKRPIG